MDEPFGFQYDSLGVEEKAYMSHSRGGIFYSFPFCAVNHGESRGRGIYGLFRWMSEVKYRKAILDN